MCSPLSSTVAKTPQEMISPFCNHTGKISSMDNKREWSIARKNAILKWPADQSCCSGCGLDLKNVGAWKLTPEGL